MPGEDIDIGRRIRQQREELGWSLRELARRSGLTASFLSQVERGLANPSIASLRRIAEALGVSLFSFLSERPPRTPVVRADQRVRLSIPQTKLEYELLTPDMNRRMEAFQAQLTPGSGNVAVPLREPTEQLIYVLRGPLAVGLDTGEYVLNTGDSMYFEGLSLRKIACAGEQEVSWISVITPPVF